MTDNASHFSELAAAPTEDEAEPTEEDAEAARRQTIAARMAKLGGIRAFGGPPIPVARKPAAESSVQASPVEPKDSSNETAPETEEEEEEDDEARRARARAKMAAIGARGFSMFGGTAAPATPPPPAVEAEKESEPGKEDGEAEDNDIQQEQLEEGTLEEDDASPESVSEGVDEDEDEAPPPPPRKQSTLPPPPAQDRFAPADDDPAVAADETESYEKGADQLEDAPPPPPRLSRGAPPVIDTHVSEEPSSISSPVGATPDSPLSRRASKGLSGMFKSRSSMDASRPPTSTAGDVSEHAPPSPSRKNSTQVDLGALSKQTGTAVHRNAESLVLQSKKAYIAVRPSPALFLAHRLSLTDSGASFSLPSTTGRNVPRFCAGGALHVALQALRGGSPDLLPDERDDPRAPRRHPAGRHHRDGTVSLHSSLPPDKTLTHHLVSFVTASQTATSRARRP